MDSGHSVSRYRIVSDGDYSLGIRAAFVCLSLQPMVTLERGRASKTCYKLKDE